MAEVHPDVEAMEGDGLTASLADFRKAYEQDDNWWWRIGCGHHQNLFDAACDLLDEKQEYIDDLEEGIRTGQLPR